MNDHNLNADLVFKPKPATETYQDEEARKLANYLRLKRSNERRLLRNSCHNTFIQNPPERKTT
jgi:hypothetical protein